MDDPNEDDALRAELREHLARELLRRRGEAPGEIETFQATTREALGSLREMLYQLRDRPTAPDAVREQIERRIDAALTHPARPPRTQGPGPAGA